jgi:glucose/mannose transport system substrate-binding protein
MKTVTPLARPIALAAAALFAAAAAQAQQTVEVLHWWTTGGTAVAAAKLKEAAQAAGVTWKDVAVAGNENQRTLLRTKLMKGDAPGVAQIVGDIEQFADQRDKLFDLSAIAKEENWDAVLPKVIQEYAKIGSGQYAAVPLNVHRLSVMYTNKAVLDKLGEKQAPTTWDDFFRVADKAKAAGINPIAWGNPQVISVMYTQTVFGTIGAQGYRKAFVEGDAATIQGAGMVKALENFRRLSNYADKSSVTKRWNEGTQSVIAGETLFQIMGDFAKGEFTRAGKKPGVDFLCTASPGTVGSLHFITDGFVFFKQRKDAPQAQAALARVLMSKKTQEEFNLLKGSVPARTDVDMSRFDECSKATYAEFNAAAKAGTLHPFVDMLIPASRAGAIRDVFVEFHSKADMTPDQAVRKLLAAVKVN